MGLEKIVTLGVLATLPVGSTAASPLAFDYKDPKEISAVSLTLDSKLEPIVGYAKGISGIVNFDPANPQATTGRIAVEVASVQFANEGYTATARGYALNGDKYPQILFTLRNVLRVSKPSNGVYQALVQADFTCKGITLPLTVPVTASYFPGLAEERTNGKYRGDVLVLRTKFDISRKKLGISEGIPDSLVGDTVQVGVAVVGLHYAPGQKPPETATPKTTASLWKMEIEQRDDPIKADAELDLNERGPTVAFTTPKGSLRAEQVTLTGDKLVFHLPDNAQCGEADGEAFLEKDTLHGVLVTKTGRLKFHARRKRSSDDVINNVAHVPPQAPDFRDLTLEAEGVKWTLAERMQFHHVPAVSLARFENYKVVETGAFGVTNVETGTPIDTNTLFQAGGMGSPLVNLLALRLAAQGRLDLNWEANAYLKSVKIPDNAFTRSRKITILDLINGASGLSQSKFTGYRPCLPIPTLTELMAGSDHAEMEPLRATRSPGTVGGEGICGAILEQVLVDATGKSFAELMQETIFTPFGMTHSTYVPDPTSLPGYTVALGHYSTGELMLDRFHVYPESGESGLWTTAGDFARMLCQVQLLLAGKPNRILKKEQRGLLKSFDTTRRVLGLIKAEGDGFLPVDYLYHGGSSYGYYANHATHQRNGSGVVVMENRILGWGLNNEIIRAVGKRQGWFGPPPHAQIDQAADLDFSLPEIRADRTAAALNLAQMQAGKSLVLFFFSEQCGVTFHYKQRLQQLQRAFEGKGFIFVGVRCGRREKPNEPLELAEAQYLKMPFVDDALGALTNVFHVRQSLTFAVIDKTGKVRYRGGFDDNVDEKQVTKSYLSDALHALSAGKPVAIKEGRAIGCAILSIK